MKQQEFRVKFLSDIVLNKTSNTEGKIENLDFITGGSFLGMVAKNYDDFSNSFEIFHSGKVRFGEATALINDKKSFKAPFCFFNPKFDYDKKEVKNYHDINFSLQDEKDKQYKQIRSGYMSEDLDYLELDYDYTQKSAHDKKLRRSQDGKMYGYSAIKKGSVFAFYLKFEEDVEHIDKVIKSLEGVHFLGKSKTAQYGKVQITKVGNIEDVKIQKAEEKSINYLYVNSSLALFEENGMPTLTPSIENLGLNQGKICWEQSQIRTYEFTPYNYKRQGKDSSRLIIEKGSVIALEDVLCKELEELSKRGIGGFLSEGYGEILIDPSFVLKTQSFELKKVEPAKDNIINPEAKKDEELVAFLQNRQNNKKRFKTLGEKVDEFVKQYQTRFKNNNITNSQWGAIRTIAQFIQDDEQCIKELEAYICHGTSKDKWAEVKDIFLDAIKKEESRDFIKLLAMKMPTKDTK